MQIPIDNSLVLLSAGNFRARYRCNITTGVCKLNLEATFLTTRRLESENKHNSKTHCGSDYR